ncbi:hypothetical protein HDU87_006408 [Geranomyces variabilis]|uniref:BZIP domain-containing protein n=1 Tax=Geranomyces variabilis TaxID=109894 RepID=A0AAD5TGN7_9FUNG|nr:hypothetical protein HDU87_006408 [Geranomyces variabilis]
MAQDNYDYISMLNMPTAELSPLAGAIANANGSPNASSGTREYGDLDLWLNTDFSFDNGMDNRGDFAARVKANAYDITSPIRSAIAHHPSPMLSQQRHEEGFSHSHAAAAAAAAAAGAPSLIVPTSFAQPGSAYPGTQNAINMFSIGGVPNSSNSTGNLTVEQFLAAAAASNAAAAAAASLVANGGSQAATAAELSTSSPSTMAAVKAPRPEEQQREKTLEEIDKRRRNTAASARFRLKKKQREQALEQTARDMSEKAAKLELRVKEYEMELKWLRQLVTDRDGKKRLRDFYAESGLAFTEGTMAAGTGLEAESSEFSAAAAAFVGALGLSKQQQHEENDELEQETKAAKRRRQS